MIRNKLKKYDDIKGLPNVMENTVVSLNPIVLSGNRDSIPLREDKPLVLELGCGRGEYTVNLARRQPEKNFIGIDIKGSRIWYGAQDAMEEKLHNVFFIRMQINHLEYFFPEKNISEIWIPFPDPYLNQPRRNAKRRLTSPEFLSRYRRILSDGGIIHLKTDEEILYRYTLETLAEEGASILYHTDDLYGSGLSGDAAKIQTNYEKRYLKLNKTIKYIKFSL